MEDGLAGFGHGGPDYLILFDEETFEELLVEEAPDTPRRLDIGALTLRAERHGQLEGVSDLLEAKLACLERALGPADLATDALLLGLEQIERHRAGVVGLHELLPLVVQDGQPPPRPGGVLLGSPPILR